MFAQNPHPADPPLRLESALLWTQASGEWRALCYQGWNVARLRLDALLPLPREKKPAVIVDIDETVLDNSPYHASVVLAAPGAAPRWADWIALADAQPIPGALDFLRYAVAQGVEIFYVTNRTRDEEAATLENLRKFDFPLVDEAHVIVRSGESSKEHRRAAIAASHDILLLCGDNLSDFADFGHRTAVARNELADTMHAEFGRRFIVFPNTFVGEWETALYLDAAGRPDPNRAERRRKHLHPAPLDPR